MNAVFVQTFLRIGQWVMNNRRDAKSAQLMIDVGGAAVAQIGHILFERHAQDGHPRIFNRLVGGDQHLDQLLGDESTHATINAPTRQNDLRVIAQFFGLGGQVIRVDTDAVTADQARLVRQKVPLGAGGSQHILGANAHAVEDQSQLVHQGNVQVALSVLDHFGGFGHLDRLGAVDASLDDRAIEVSQRIQRGFIFARHHFDDFGQGVQLVAGVDPLWRVAQFEIHPLRQPGCAG